MERVDHGKTASSSAVPSRLSPLAQPFSSNRFTSTSLLKSLSGINLEDDQVSTESYSCYAHESGTTIGALFPHDLLDFGEDSQFSEYPSANAGSDFGCIPSASCEYLPTYTEHPSYGQMHSKASLSSSKNASSGYETLLEQDHVDAGSLSFSEVHTAATPYKFSKPVMCSTSQTQLPYTAPAVTWSNCNPQVALCESGLTKLDPCTAKSVVCHSPTRNNFPALVLESSHTSTTVSPLNPFFSKNVETKGNCTLGNNDCSSKCSFSGIKDLHHVMYGVGKEIHHDGSPNVKGKEGKDGKPLSGEGMCSLVKAISEPLITLTNIPDDFSLEHLGSKEALSLSKKVDEDDSDLDSPCWKGTLASKQSPLGVSRSLSSDFVEHQQEVRNSLNPLAPHFFPRPAETIVNYHANDYAGDNFSSFQKNESSTVNSFSKGHRFVDQAGSKSSLPINGIRTQSASDVHELERVHSLLNNSESGCVLNSLEGLPNLLSKHSKMDVPTILNVIHSLSELLVQTCSNDFDALNEDKHDLIQRIINNLCMCIQQRAGGPTPMSEITLTGTPYCPNKSTNLHMVGSSSMGLQVARTKAFAIPHDFDNQNGHEGRRVNSHVFTGRMLDSFSPCSGVGTENNNDLIQVMGNALRDNNHLTKEELDPQALVYKKLWLEAQAELCSMKYETCVLCMKLEGGRRLDKNKVSGKLLTRDLHWL